MLHDKKKKKKMSKKMWNNEKERPGNRNQMDNN